MLQKVDPRNPAPRHLNMITEKLKAGGVIIYPTDTVYAAGCDLNNKKALEKLSRITGKKAKQNHFSLICSDISSVSDYTVPFDNKVYKLMKKMLPGPVTFILKPNSKIPKLFNSNKKTIGVRIPDHPIPIAIVKALGAPLITTSLHHDDDDIIKYYTDPEEIYERYKNHADMIIDGGSGDNTGSAVIDCSDGDITVLRDNRKFAEEYIA